MNKFLQICVFLIFSLIVTINPSVAKINTFATPRYIPALNIYDDVGKSYTLSDFKSDLLIAIVWAKTCGPCLGDLRLLGEFVEKTKNKGIEVILISPEKDWRNVTEKRTFLRRLQASNMVSFNDKNNRFRDGMGILVTPTAVLVNKHGEEVAQITGSVKWNDPKVIQYIIELKDEVLKQLDERKTADK